MKLTNRPHLHKHCLARCHNCPDHAKSHQPWSRISYRSSLHHAQKRKEGWQALFWTWSKTELTSTSNSPNGPSSSALSGPDRSFRGTLVVSQLVPPLRAVWGNCVSGMSLGMVSVSVLSVTRQSLSRAKRRCDEFCLREGDGWDAGSTFLMEVRLCGQLQGKIIWCWKIMKGAVAAQLLLRCFQ